MDLREDAESSSLSVNLLPSMELSSPNGRGGDTATAKQEEDPPSFEMVLEELGMPGRFQIEQIGLSLLSLLMCSFMSMSIVFLGFTPDHECRHGNDSQIIIDYGLENDSTAFVSYGKCDIDIFTNKTGEAKVVSSLPCPQGREFFDAKGTTYVSEWDLVCESVGQGDFSHTVFTIGQIVGGIIASFIADRFGRKPVIIASSTLGCLVEGANILSPSIYVVYVMRFLSGIFYMAVVNSAIVFGTEMVVPRHRQVYGIVMNVLWITYVFVVAVAAYILRYHNWRYFQATGAVFGLIFLIIPFILKESPRWLAANKKTDEALQILKFACEKNRKDFHVVKEKFNAFMAYSFPENKEVTTKMSKDEQVSHEENFMVKIKTKIVTSSLLAVFRNKTIVFLMIVSWFIWLTNILTYFGLYITASTLAGDRFLNVVLMNLVEFPSMVLLLFMANRLSRRFVLAFFMILTVTSLLISALLITLGQGLRGSEIAVTTTFILGKFAISSSFGMVYIITPELFPTNVRSTASGVCNALGRIGSSFAPYLRPLYSEAKWAPAFLLTAVCSVAVFLIWFLPETKDRDLPNTIEEMMEQKRKKNTKNQNHERGKQNTRL